MLFRCRWTADRHRYILRWWMFDRFGTLSFGRPRPMCSGKIVRESIGNTNWFLVEGNQQDFRSLYKPGFEKIGIFGIFSKNRVLTVFQTIMYRCNSKFACRRPTGYRLVDLATCKHTLHWFRLSLERRLVKYHHDNRSNLRKFHCFWDYSEQFQNSFECRLNSFFLFEKALQSPRIFVCMIVVHLCGTTRAFEPGWFSQENIN